jgi:catechol 2,3-dioxygenase-like lactoylglutathione lyase family enzyme
MNPLRITAMDHIVLNVSDVERSLAFYTEMLGLKPERVEEFRSGKVGFPSVRISESTLIDLVSDGAEQGSSRRNLNHFCLTAQEIDLGALADDLEAKGVTITVRPASRWGARGQATSIYILDPDENEIEIRHY